MPAEVLARWFRGLNNARELLRPLAPDDTDRFGAADSALMFDDEGRLVPAQFYPLTWAPIVGCRRIPAGQTQRISLERRQIHEPNLTLRIEAAAISDGSLAYRVHDDFADNEQATQADSEPELARNGEISMVGGVLPLTTAGTDRYLLLPPQGISAVSLTAEGTSVCVTSIVVGQPAP